MAHSHTTSGLPEIPARPEILNAMRALGTHIADVESTYELLRSIAQEYLPAQASERQGKLIGMYLAYTLIPPWTAPRPPRVRPLPPSNDRAGDLRRLTEGFWREAAAEEPSPLAADRAIWALTAELYLLCWEPWMEDAFTMLSEGKLRALFPPQDGSL